MKQGSERTNGGLEVQDGADEPAGRSLAPESGHAPSRAGVWDSGRRRKTVRGSVFGSGALRKVADLLFALLDDVLGEASEDTIVDKDYGGLVVDRRSTTRYCTFLGGT
ncbi:hypothetical protein CK203_093144 [Vitis vinifera]|uniref:Uncharacterized protein n=1 Tax=Vitis vinifera TaxID=29760 RepID=A0A438D6N3_VITVI|nr:hypothetical protein CK203_093144 [Vitis vinifera]